MLSSESGARILVIDDDDELRHSIVAYLEDSGFEIIEAQTGEQGLELFREKKPDLVLSDLQMPGLNGLQVLKVLSIESPDTPTIVISGTGGMKDVIDALRLGAWDYLTKPIPNLTMLEHAICKCLERARLITENLEYRNRLERNLAILQADQEAGRSVQLRLLPEQGLSFGQFQFFHAIMPSLYLSGDFLDYFRISENKVGFYVADVSGHGSSSAFITVILKSIMNQINRWHQTGKNSLILEPNLVLSTVSSDIYSSQLGKYLTMIYGVLDETTQTLTYSIGGHYPNPVLLRPGEGAHFLQGKGFPVGIMRKVHYHNLQQSLQPGDSIVLFSDGILEILKADNMEAKENQLLEYLVETGGDLERLKERLGIIGTNQFPDDITLLKVICKP